jgi:ketosteroid isomerase-like protein
VVRGFAQDATLKFPGDNPFGGTFDGRDAIRGWFEHLHEVFPDFRLEPETILVNGFPWDTVVATRFKVTATLPDGSPYANNGMQFLRLRCGRIVEDVLYEDTQYLSAVLSENAASDQPGVAPGPLSST